MKDFFKIKFILILLLSSCNKEKPDAAYSNSNFYTLIHDEIERGYYLFIPDSYNNDTKLPLLLNFHGFGGTAYSYIDKVDLRSLANSENFILVYAQGTSLGPLPHWNAGLDTPNNKSNADDFGFVDKLITNLSNNYNIDSERIYASGYSNGAMFSYALACYSDKIKGIASIAGTMLNETYNECNPSHPISMINIHGSDDDTIPYNGSRGGFTPIQDVVDYWVNFNKTSINPEYYEFNDNQNIIEEYTYNQGKSNTSVKHIKIIGGGHKNLFEINFEGNAIAKIIWEFFSK